MKTLLTFYLALIGFTALATGTDSAIAYNNTIVNEQNKITKMMIAFSASPTDTALDNIKSQARAGLDVLNSIQAYNGDTSLLPAAKALFQFYLDVANNEYGHILLLLKNKGQYSFEDLSSRMLVYVNSISTNEKPLDARFTAAQQAFATQYGFVIQNNQLQDQLDATGSQH
jgi:hypothetical protein